MSTSSGPPLPIGESTGPWGGHPPSTRPAPPRRPQPLPVPVIDDVFPGGRPLVLSVGCSSDPNGHLIRIHPDWSVEVPHDLELERIAAAMGGERSTCLDLVDRTIPALRDHTLQDRRVVVPGIVPHPSTHPAGLTWHGPGISRWRIAAPVPHCDCSGRTFTFVDAARHLREERHWAGAHGANRPSLRRLIHALATLAPRTTRQRVWPDAPPLAADEADQLWEAGVHPRRIAEIDHELQFDGTLPRLQAPLSVEAYLNIAVGVVSPAWLSQFADLGPAALSWAAATYVPDEPDDARSGWLDLAAARDEIPLLLACGYQPDDGARLAESLQIMPWHAATLLTEWATVGCRPAADQISHAARLGRMIWPAPTQGVLADLTRITGGNYPRTLLGLLLVATRSIQRATALIAQGVTTLDDFDTLTQGELHDRPQPR